jgi:hypothetical protein
VELAVEVADVAGHSTTPTPVVLVTVAVQSVEEGLAG